MGSAKKLDPNRGAVRKKRREMRKKRRQRNIRQALGVGKAVTSVKRLRVAARRRSLYGYAGVLGSAAMTDEATIRTSKLLGA